MKILKESSKNLKYEFTVEISSEEIEKKVEESLKKYGEKAKIPGFRPGKAPLSILKQRYDASARQDAIEDSIKSSMKKVMEEKSLRAAVQPKVDIASFEPGKNLTYTMEVEAMPEVKLKDLKKIDFTQLEVKISDKDIEEQATQALEAQNKTVAVEKERKAKKGDVVVIDAIAFSGKEAAEDQNIENFHVTLGAGHLEEFEKALEGLKVGDTVDINFTMPKEFPNKEHAGKKFTFKSTFKELREPLKIELTDEVAKEFNFEDLKALKEEIKKQLEESLKNPVFVYAKRQILDALAKQYDFALPETLVEEEFKVMWHEAEHELEHKKEKPSEKELEKMKKEYRELAERRVRLGLVLATMGQENKISVPNDKVRDAMIQTARSYRGQEKEVFEYLSKNKEALAQIRSSILEDEVINFIIEKGNGKKKEVTIEQLKKEIEKLNAEDK